MSGANFSATTVTSKPSLRKHSAVVRPVTPAPMTSTRGPAASAVRPSMPSSFLSLLVGVALINEATAHLRVLVGGKLLERLRAGREVGEALHPVVDDHAVEG